MSDLTFKQIHDAAMAIEGATVEYDYDGDNICALSIEFANGYRLRTIPYYEPNYQYTEDTIVRGFLLVSAPVQGSMRRGSFAELPNTALDFIEILPMLRPLHSRNEADRFCRIPLTKLMVVAG